MYFCIIKRMTRQISILLILMLGFFLTPTQTYACGKPAERPKRLVAKKKLPKQKRKTVVKVIHRMTKTMMVAVGNVKILPVIAQLHPLLLLFLLFPKRNKIFYLLKSKTFLTQKPILLRVSVLFGYRQK